VTPTLLGGAEVDLRLLRLVVGAARQHGGDEQHDAQQRELSRDPHAREQRSERIQDPDQPHAAGVDRAGVNLSGYAP